LEAASQKIEKIVQNLSSEVIGISDDEELSEILAEYTTAQVDTSVEQQMSSLTNNAFVLDTSDWVDTVFNMESIEFDKDQENVVFTGLKTNDLLQYISDTGSESNSVIDSDETNIDDLNVDLFLISSDDELERQIGNLDGQTNLLSQINSTSVPSDVIVIPDSPSSNNSENVAKDINDDISDSQYSKKRTRGSGDIINLDSSRSIDSDESDLSDLVDKNEVGDVFSQKHNIHRSITAQNDDEELEILKRFLLKLF
jgi:hypothetical protein